MIPQKRILVVVDPTTTVQPAVARAAWLAQQLPSRIELFICDNSSAPGGRPGTDDGLVADARERMIAGHVRRLQELAAPLAASGVQVDIDARWEPPLHAGVVRKVVESKADLVLKDTHYVAPLRRALFSNTDWSLIRTCPAPLWLVKSRSLAIKPVVLAAVDPFHEHDKPAKLDGRIVSAATELTDAAHGELHLFHGVDITPLLATAGEGLPIPAPMPALDLLDIFRKQHETAVAEFAKAHGIAPNRAHVRVGAVGESLTSLADELRADVVVMGAVSRSGLKRLFIGSTAENVLDRLGCDLLLVKPEAMPPDAG